jgi:translation initiation factor 6 (eIF-6)
MLGKYLSLGYATQMNSSVVLFASTQTQTLYLRAMKGFKTRDLAVHRHAGIWPMTCIGNIVCGNKKAARPNGPSGLRAGGG